ncbi:MAG: DICT sensory domain-containing protein [Spirulinaceae cyanobacterium]
MPRKKPQTKLKSISNSVLAGLLKMLPNWRQQMYFKSSLTALSHAMEDLVLASSEETLVIASFQRERFYRQEANRYRRIAEKSTQVYVLAAPETDFENSSELYETVAFGTEDALCLEWHLVAVSQQYATCLICREKLSPEADSPRPEGDVNRVDSSRRFEGVWTFDRQVSCYAAEILLQRISDYRPELVEKIEQAREIYLRETLATAQIAELLQQASPSAHPDPFVQRLVTYLQAGQYKLLKAYRSIAAKQERERLLHSMTVAIRRSLNPEEILQVAVRELGKALDSCRTLIYRCQEDDKTATLNHEFLAPQIESLQGRQWPLKNNPLLQQVIKQKESLQFEDVLQDSRITGESLHSLLQRCGLVSWLMVPVLYQDRLLGMVELHHCHPDGIQWAEEEVTLVEAIATQVGVALIQAEAYANLEDLNQQLEALDRTRSNLVAITGHELRTPLSTIQICLESLASEPDMPPELRQTMLSTALSDAERMRKLVQDFLTLSRLEGGRVEWNPEPLSLRECIDLALSNVRARNRKQEIPDLTIANLPNLPLVQADGEWLVEVLAKLLDNACKFTSSEGQVIIGAKTNGTQMIDVTVADTGRGIEATRLETVFDRFYQEEGALRRTTGGTGLGLAICRQIVRGWGGKIWAESQGKEKGCKFHFTVPIANGNSSYPNP